MTLPHRFRSILLLPMLLILAGCATAPAPEKSGTVFYPPLPNSPRIQFLTSFSGALDLKRETGAFAQFVFGEETEEDKSIVKPYGIGMADGKVYVVDTRGPGYVIVDLDKNEIEPIRSTGAGSMNKPINIAFDKQGNRYIADTGLDQVLVFDRLNSFVRAYGTEGQMKPSDVLVMDEKLFIADVGNHRIRVLNKDTGVELFSFGGAGSGKSELFHPTNLAITPDGDLLVSDTGNYRIQRFKTDGTLVDSYGTVGTGVGQFARPKGIATDRSGRFYVVDSAFENIQLFDQSGRLLLFFGGPGNGPENLNLPTDVEIDYRNIEKFRKYADPNFSIEYIILVTNQFGLRKVSVFGFGRMAGMQYDEETFR